MVFRPRSGLTQANDIFGIIVFALVTMALVFPHYSLGDSDQEFKWLQRVINVREPAVIEIDTFGEFDSLRGASIVDGLSLAS